MKQETMKKKCDFKVSVPVEHVLNDEKGVEVKHASKDRE
jgi:hypothetical protein